MDLTFALQRDDFVNYHLYTASKSKRIAANRLRSRLLVAAAFLSLAYLFYAQHNALLGWYFVALAVVAALFYPYYQRGVYKRHYQKSIAEAYEPRFGKPFILHIESDKLWAKDEFSEESINFAGITEVIEVPAAFYIKTPAGTALIIPKQLLPNLQEVRAMLAETAARFHFPYKQELNWTWR